MFGLVTTGWMWVRMAALAVDKPGAPYEAKLATAQFYVARLLPQVFGLAASIEAGAATVMAPAVAMEPVPA
jgi:hypothetical protein